MSATFTSADHPPPTAEEILDHCRTLVRPALSEAVDRLYPSTRAAAAYACGLDVPPGRAPRTGKGVRQAYAVLAGESVGGPAASAVPAAVAVELLHVFSLVHDDIMDRDEQRRHRATVWKAFGVGPAVLVGDALYALALTVLNEAAGAHTPRALGLVCEALSGLMRGQALDLDFERRPVRGPDAVSVEEYRAMAAGKTGALFGCAAGLGALLAEGEPAVVEAFVQAGTQLGLAFQAVDDLLGIWGDPRRTGKPAGSDLRNRKQTLPVVWALAEGGPAGRRLARLLETPGELAESQVRGAMALIEEAGGRARTLTEGRRCLGTAVRTLDGVTLRPGARGKLAVVSDYLVGRTL